MNLNATKMAARQQGQFEIATSPSCRVQPGIMAVSTPQAIRSRLILAGVAAFAMAWAISRAVIQSITIDEAMTYNIFVHQGVIFQAHTNNHLLNSLLMYMFTKVLGLSQFTARLPALIGAALYITAAYRLSRLVGASLISQMVLLVCLVFNPFIFDYLVAARGYALALGFLLWAIVYSAEWHLHQRGSLFFACAVSSTCAGLSIDSNFSFAFVNLVTMTAILLCAWYRRPKQFFRVVASCVIPGSVVTTLVAGYSLYSYRRALGQFNGGLPMYGAQSLSETFGSIIESSLFQTRFGFLKATIFPLVGLTGLIWLVYLLFQRLRRTEYTAWLVRFAVILAAILAVTAGIHWVMFYTFGLPLPEDRTAIFFYPLLMIAAGLLAAIPSPSGVGTYVRTCFQGALVVMACYFLLCLRLTYFKEWYWDADVDKAYSILSCLNRTYQVTRVTSTWAYRGPLLFYQIAKPTSIREIDEKSRSEHNASLRGGHSAFPGSSENWQPKDFLSKSDHRPGARGQAWLCRNRQELLSLTLHIVTLVIRPQALTVPIFLPGKYPAETRLRQRRAAESRKCYGETFVPSEAFFSTLSL